MNEQPHKNAPLLTLHTRIMNQETPRKTQEESFDLEQIGLLFLSHWYYFVASAIITVALALYYVMQTTPIYMRNTQLLIKNDDTKNTSALSEFKDLGIMQSTSNINNEMLTLSAPVMMNKVVKRLGLDLQMEVANGLHNIPLYNEAPVSIETPAPLPENLFFSFKLMLTRDGKAVLSDFVTTQGEHNKSITVAVDGGMVQTPAGKLGIKRTPSWSKEFIGQEIFVNKYPVEGITALYSGRLGVALNDKESSVLNLSMTDECPERASDILLTLVDVYNENWIKEKNRVAESTNKFITERLETLTQELGDVDASIADYKSENLMPDVAASLAKDMSQSSNNYSRLLELNNQLSMTNYLREYLTDNSKKDQLLPANVGLSTGGVDAMITQYNNLLLERMSYVENSTESNPAIRDIDRRLSSQRTAIIRSIDNLAEQLRRQIAGIEASERQITGNIASKPGQVKALQSVERQQKVKEALYIFLLQKREENELSRTYTAWNSSIIQPPIGSNSPTSPKRNNILLIALVIGLAIPAALLYLREILDHAVRGRKDLEVIDVPLVGEIPNIAKQRYWWQKKNDEDRKVVVSEGNKNIINESFRLLRTKLTYFIGAEKNKKVIMLTSFNPGSGKSFITANLGTTYAISGKRVLLIDCDVRHFSLSTMIEKRKEGLSSFLSGMDNDLESLIVKDAFYAGCDVLPVGIVPPNPTELLQSDRFKLMMDIVREQYDLIILDCPPIEIVADAGIVKEHADATIFVVRAGLMDRRVLKDVEELYHEKKYNQLCILLNGTKYISGKYGRYRYGYGYGYGYSYGYGYGYNAKGYHEK